MNLNEFLTRRQASRPVNVIIKYLKRQHCVFPTFFKLGIFHITFRPTHPHTTTVTKATPFYDVKKSLAHPNAKEKSYSAFVDMLT